MFGSDIKCCFKFLFAPGWVTVINLVHCFVVAGLIHRDSGFEWKDSWS